MARLNEKPFSRMRSKGFSFNSGGLEAGVVFAQRCFGGREGTATVRRVPAPRSQNLTIGQRSQSVIRMMCLRSISAQIACFVAFCDMRGGSVCVLRDRPNAL